MYSKTVYFDIAFEIMTLKKPDQKTYTVSLFSPRDTSWKLENDLIS